MKKLTLFLLLPLIFAIADEGESVDAPDSTLEEIDGNTVCLDSLRAEWGQLYIIH